MNAAPETDFAMGAFVSLADVAVSCSAAALAGVMALLVIAGSGNAIPFMTLADPSPMVAEVSTSPTALFVIAEQFYKEQLGALTEALPVRF